MRTKVKRVLVFQTLGGVSGKLNLNPKYSNMMAVGAKQIPLNCTTFGCWICVFYENSVASAIRSVPRHGNKTESTSANSIFVDQAPVVQRVDSAIQWINHYPLDNTINFDST